MLGSGEVDNFDFASTVLKKLNFNSCHHEKTEWKRIRQNEDLQEFITARQLRFEGNGKTPLEGREKGMWKEGQGLKNNNISCFQSDFN